MQFCSVLMFSFCLVRSRFVTDYYKFLCFFSCKEPVEPLTLEEVAERCHAPEDVIAISFIVNFCYTH